MAGKRKARKIKMLSERELESIEWDAIPEGMPKYDGANWEGYSYKEAIENDLARPESARALRRESGEKPAASFTDMEEMRKWLDNL